MLDERIHSFDPCCLYWITKLLIGHELDFQADRCSVIYEELIVTKDVLSGANRSCVVVQQHEIIPASMVRRNEDGDEERVRCERGTATA